MWYGFNISGYQVNVSEHGYFVVLTSAMPPPCLAGSGAASVIYNGWVHELDPQLSYDPELDSTYFGTLGHISHKEAQDARDQAEAERIHTIVATVNHETMHWVLLKTMSKHTSAMFDGLYLRKQWGLLPEMAGDRTESLQKLGVQDNL